MVTSATADDATRTAMNLEQLYRDHAPAITAALALRTLCGFSTASLSRALKTDAAALEKRLGRARQALRDQGVTFEHEGDVDAVLRTLYVLFFEGYVTNNGELCETALRLARLL